MRKLIIPSIATALTVAAMLYQGKTVTPVLCEPPDVHLPELVGYTSEVLGPSEAEKESLVSDTRVEKRRYTDGRGDWFQVTVVIGGATRASIHRPERCLPSQGFRMSDQHTVESGDLRWNVKMLSRGDVAAAGFAYTFFNQDGYYTVSHFRRILRDVWDRSVHGRIDRWVMVTVFSPSADGAALTGFLEKLKDVLK